MKVWLSLGVAGVLGLTLAGLAGGQDDKKKSEDSPIVAKTRKKLETPVTHDAKDQPLQELLKELETQAEVKFRIDPAVPKHKSFSLSVKEKALKDALSALFEGSGIGFLVHRKQNANDRYEGYIDIVQGDQRGDDLPPKKDEKAEKGKDAAKKPAASKPASKNEPTKADDAEKSERQAASKLKLAKMLLDDGKTKDAIESMEEIMKKHPGTKAAAEAKELITKHKNG
jgi:thioredoxin-like negative regulator of GroEL